MLPHQVGVTRPVVDILSFDGCPNRDAALSLVKAVSSELDVDPKIRVMNITDAHEAVAERFLGSPTVRVDGVDVEPGAEAREDFVLGCRVYRTPAGYEGTPDAEWVRDALRNSAS